MAITASHSLAYFSQSEREMTVRNSARETVLVFGRARLGRSLALPNSKRIALSRHRVVIAISTSKIAHGHLGETQNFASFKTTPFAKPQSVPPKLESCWP